MGGRKGEGKREGKGGRTGERERGRKGEREGEGERGRKGEREGEQEREGGRELTEGAAYQPQRLSQVLRQTTVIHMHSELHGRHYKYYMYILVHNS